VSEKPRGARPSTARGRIPDRPPARVLLNLTAYDGLASGARERALGLAGALARGGAEVILAEARGADLAALVPVAAGAAPPRVLRTDLDPGRPLDRFRRGPAVFEAILRAERPDLFLTDFHPVPRVEGTATVVTVHDLRDLSGEAAARPLRRAYLRTAYGRLLRRAALVVAPSAFARDEAVALLGVDRRRTAVVPNAVSAELAAPGDPEAAARTRERLDLPRRPYLLALGVLERRKNLARLLEALALLHGEGARPGPLVIAGRGGPEEGDLRRRAAALPAGAVHWAGYVRPADLPAVYDGARALVHPALYEGFGMPVVEAMARGIPVACAAAAALPEAAGGAAHLFDPRDPGSIARAVANVSIDETLRAALVRRGRARAASLTWAHSAAALLSRTPA
jgi:glycosyltransferase involved in cell wall biosynthesis